MGKQKVQLAQDRNLTERVKERKKKKKQNIEKKNVYARNKNPQSY